MVCIVKTGGQCKTPAAGLPGYPDSADCIFDNEALPGHQSYLYSNRSGMFEQELFRLGGPDKVTGF